MPNQAKVAAIYAELQLQTAQFKAALGDAQSETKKFSAQMRQSSEEAKGSIALLGEQIGIALPRHLRNFVAELPGVSAAMSAAFDAVAVLALIDLVVKAREKVYAFIERNEQAAKANAAAWESIAKPIGDVNRELDLSNAKLTDTIARMEKSPGDGVKNALLEAADAAHKLSEQLDEDIKKITDLTSKEQSSFLDKLIGDDTGGDISRTIAFGAQQYKTISSGYDDVLQRAADKGDWQNYNDTRTDEIKELMGALGPQIATLQDYLRKNQDLVGTNDPNFEKAKSGYNALVGLMQAVQQQADHEQLTQRQGTDQAHLDSTDAANKLDAQRLKALQDYLNQKEELFGKDTAWEAQYWTSSLAELHQGSDAYQQVLEKAHAAQIASEDALHKQIEQLRARAAIAAPSFTLLPNSGELTAAIAKESEAQAQLNEEWAASKTRIDLLTGAITPHEAALAAAAAHADDYKQKLAALQQQLGDLQKNDALAAIFGPDQANQAKETQVKTQIDQLSGAYKIQALEDSQSELNTTWTGMIDSVWDALIKRAQDTQQELAHIATQFVDGMNSELAKGITGEKMDFSKVFENSAQGLAKTGLQSLEGMGLKALGVGKTKRDGSSEGSALYVQTVGGSSNIPGFDSIFGSAMPKVNGPSGAMTDAASISRGLLGMLNNSNWAGSLFGGKLFGAGGIFDHFATGGDAPAGVPIRVGELGPEDLTLPFPGHITPNRDLRGAGGPITMQIDARGTDPSLTRANFQRALTATHAQAVHDASRAMVEKQRRTAR